MDRNLSKVSRRGVLAGVGGAAALLGTAAPAGAAPPFPAKDARRRPAGVPSGIMTLSSPPEPGVSYRFALWLDTTPLNDLASGRTFASTGAYTSASSDYLAASFDLAPGVRVHDIEAYYSADLVSSFLVAAIWGSGAGDVDSELASVQIGPFPDNAVHATRTVVPSASNGPFPHGTKLVVYASTTSVGTVAVNGFRVGFKNAPLSTVLLPVPARVYDSRRHSPITAGHTRTVPLGSHLPVGANGAQYVLSVVGAHGSGALYAGPDGATPALPGVRWNSTGEQAAECVTTPVSGGRKVAIRSVSGSGKTDFTVDLVGYLV